MATELRIPKLGMSMTEGGLQEWFIEDGARVEAGVLLYALESDKSVNEIEAPESGTLRILAQPGAVYQVGDLIGRID